MKRKGYCQEMVGAASDLVVADGASVLVRTVTATATANSNRTESSSKNDKENKMPPAGLKIVDMDVDDNFIQESQVHANKCHCPMTRVSQTKMGFDLKEHWRCSFCRWTIHRRSGKDANPLTPKRGPRPSELNINVTTAFFESGVGVDGSNCGFVQRVGSFNTAARILLKFVNRTSFSSSAFTIAFF